MSERHGERPDTPETEPAPTITSKARTARWDVWRYRNGNQENAAEREPDQPAPTVHFGHALNEVKWVRKRPATTLAGDPRLGSPGHRDREGGERQFQPDAVRVTLAEAAILQGFPPDYPFAGSRTKQFEQVGNAVPPPLARAVIEALVGEALEDAA